MKAGGLQRTNSLFWFMACHVIAKVHRISRWRAASSSINYVKTHYPSGRTWANIFSSSGYASPV